MILKQVEGQSSRILGLVFAKQFELFDFKLSEPSNWNQMKGNQSIAEVANTSS